MSLSEEKRKMNWDILRNIKLQLGEMRSEIIKGPRKDKAKCHKSNFRLNPDFDYELCKEDEKMESETVDLHFRIVCNKYGEDKVYEGDVFVFEIISTETYILVRGVLKLFEIERREFQYPPYPINYWDTGSAWINVKKARLGKECDEMRYSDVIGEWDDIQPCAPYILLDTKTRLTPNLDFYSSMKNQRAFLETFLILLEREDATSFLIRHMWEDKYEIQNITPGMETGCLWDHLYWQLTTRNYETDSFFSQTILPYAKISKSRIEEVERILKNIEMVPQLIKLIIGYM